MKAIIMNGDGKFPLKTLQYEKAYKLAAKGNFPKFLTPALTNKERDGVLSNSRPLPFMPSLPLVPTLVIMGSMVIAVLSLTLNYMLGTLMSAGILSIVVLIGSDIQKYIRLTQVGQYDGFRFVPKGQIVIILICMGISLFAFVKVITVKNSEIDGNITNIEEQRKQYQEEKKNHDIIVASLQEAALREKQSSIPQSEINATLIELNKQKAIRDKFLTKHTWYKYKGDKKSKKYFFSEILVDYKTTNGIKEIVNVCDLSLTVNSRDKWSKRRYDRMRISKRKTFCPRISGTLSKIKSLESKYDMQVSSKFQGIQQAKLENALQARQSFLSNTPEHLKTSSRQNTNKSAQISVLTAIIMGLIAELMGYLFISSTMWAHAEIRKYRKAKLNRAPFFVQLLNSYTVLPELNLEAARQYLISVADKDGNLKNSHFEMALNNQEIFGKFTTLTELKDFLLGKKVVVKRSIYSYRISSYKTFTGIDGDDQRGKAKSDEQKLEITINEDVV